MGASLFEDDAERLRRDLAIEGLEDRFVHAGWLEEHELPNVLAAADVALYLMDDTLLNRSKCPVKLAEFCKSNRFFQSFLVLILVVSSHKKLFN